MDNTLTADQIKLLGAFTPAQVTSYNRFRATGFSPEKSLSLVLSPVPTRGQKEGVADDDGVFVGQNSLLSSIIDAGNDLGSGFQNVGLDAERFGVTQALIQSPVRVLSGLARGTGRAIGGVLETADDLTGEVVSSALMPPLTSALETETAQDVISYLDGINQKGRGLPLDILEILTADIGVNLLKAPIRGAIAEGRNVIRGAGNSLSDFMKPPVREAEGVISLTPTGAIREAAEALAPSLTVSERLLGITPDVKGRLQEAGEDLTRQYIDVAKTRNVTDTIIDANGNRIPAPTPYGFGAEKAHEVADVLQKQINETGSVIGQTRQRLSSYRATIDQMNAIEKRLVSEAEKMNLTIKNGKVVRIRGIQTASDGDIRAIQTIYNNLKVVKESQSLTDLIEFRSAVDQNVKFGKRASEVSDAIDPLSRVVRGEVADVAAKIVGKTEAAELAKYSNFMDALADLRSFTDRRAGGEYLLRLVSSGRGDEARRLVETIREYTGIDLMNDATLMVKVTDLIGNDAQKNLFRQEITKAQLDVQAILSGSPTSIVGRGVDRTIDFFTDEEQILINASRKTPTPTSSLPTPTGLNNTQGGFISLGGFMGESSEVAFKNFEDLSTKLLGKLEGRTTVSKQFISDLTNSPDLKQAERDLFREILKGEGDTVNVQAFADKVKTELLPLQVNVGKFDNGLGGKFENISLPPETRGNIASYRERIYESPIKTSAGDVHFGSEDTPNYFAHTRIEDMANPVKGADRKLKIVRGSSEAKPFKVVGDGVDQNFATRAQAEKGIEQFKTTIKEGEGTRRVIELQSDLFQKGRLEDSIFRIGDEDVKKGKQELSKLEPYRNTWQERIIREEVKQAAIDGKTKLQFPTGETAMKIEGLGETSTWVTKEFDNLGAGGTQRTHTNKLTPDSLKVGQRVWQGEVGQGRDWIITDVLGDGKFRAMTKTTHDDLIKQNGKKYPFSEDAVRRYTEEFDISGKIDTENPIYKFYEKEVGRYLKNKYNATLITDPQGVKWWEVNITKDMSKAPIEAFGVLPFAPFLLGKDEE